MNASEGGLERLLGEAERRELEVLAGEADPESFFEGLLRVGKRLEAANRLEVAAAVYATIVGAEHVQPLRRTAKKQLDALQGKGPFSPRFECLLKNFTREAGDPRTIFPMLLGTTAYQLVRTAALGRLAGTARAAWWTRGIGARFAAAGAGYAVEVPVFAISGRALRQVGGPSSFQPGLAPELASAALTLGVLKVFGLAGNRAFSKFHGMDARGLAVRAPGAMPFTRALSSQSAMFAGLLTAHALEARLGLRPQVDGATTVTDTLSSMLSLGVGAQLGRRLLGRRFAAFSGEMELRVRLAEGGGPLRPGGWGAMSALASAPAVRQGERRGAWLSLAVMNGGPGGRPEPGRARRDLEKLLDHPRLDVAWTALERWREFEPALKPEDISVLAAKLAKRMDAKGELPPRLAILMMRQLLPRLPRGEAVPIYLQLEAKLAHPDEKIAEAALEVLAAAGPQAPLEVAEHLRPRLESLVASDHPWLPAKALQALGALTEALPPSRRLFHALQLDSRMTELGLYEAAVLPRAARALLPEERLVLARSAEAKLFAEEAGAAGERREALSQLLRQLPDSERSEFRLRLQSLAEDPRSARGLAALQILGEWAGLFSAAERTELTAWAAPWLGDRRLSHRMTAMEAIWKWAREFPAEERLDRAEILTAPLRDASPELRRAALGAWGLLARGLPAEQRLAVAAKLLALRGDPEAELRALAWRELSDMAEGLDSRRALELLRLCLSEAWIGKIPVEFFRILEEKIPKESLPETPESTAERDLWRYAAYRRAGLPFEERLWKAYLRAAKPSAFLDAAALDLRRFRRGESPDPKQARQVLLAYAALEVSASLPFSDFRSGLRGKTPPPPFMTEGFRAAVREQVSLHGLIDKGKLAQALAPLEVLRSDEAFRKDLKDFVTARLSELRAVKEVMKAAFPEEIDGMSRRALRASAQAVLPGLWGHRELPAVRELILRFGLFLAWDRLKDSPLRERMLAARSKKISSKALGEALQATEEFYRDRLGDVFRERGLDAGELPAVRRQRQALASELGRLGQAKGAETEVEFLPSKSEADRYFAYVAEDCNEGRQKAIFRPDFQLLRLVAGERLRGLIYLQAARLDGKTVLILGLQPRPTWEVDHRDLLRVVEREFGRIGEARGYDAVLLMADDNQQSNRRDMLEAIRERGYPKRVFKQEVSDAVFEGREFLALWERRAGRR